MRFIGADLHKKSITFCVVETDANRIIVVKRQRIRCCEVDRIEALSATVDTILQSARHGDDGKVGDGKIFITPLEECIRISNGERGGAAI